MLNIRDKNRKKHIKNAADYCNQQRFRFLENQSSFIALSAL